MNRNVHYAVCIMSLLTVLYYSKPTHLSLMVEVVKDFRADQFSAQNTPSAKFDVPKILVNMINF